MSYLLKIIFFLLAVFQSLLLISQPSHFPKYQEVSLYTFGIESNNIEKTLKSRGVQAQADTIRKKTGDFFVGYINDSAQFHGLLEYFRPDSTLSASVEYKNGNWDGKFLDYDTSGNILLNIDFKNNKMDGVYIKYFENGRIKVEANLKKGKYDGVYKKFYKNGTLEYEQTYLNDELNNESIYYYTNGSKSKSYFYKNGKLEDTVLTYHKNGKIEWTLPYKNDYPNGKRFVKDSTGKLANGIYKTVYEAGENWEIYCKEGLPNGECVRTDTKGNVIIRNTYQNGKIDGIFTSYYRDEVIKSQDVYVDGSFIGTILDGHPLKLPTLSKLITLQPEKLDWQFMRFKEYVSLDKLDSARLDLQNIIQLDPSNANAYYNLGFLHAKNGELLDAKPFLEKCINLDKKHAMAYYNLGYIEYQLENKKLALKYFNKAIAIKPDFEEAIINRDRIKKLFLKTKILKDPNFNSDISH